MDLRYILCIFDFIYQFIDIIQKRAVRIMRKVSVKLSRNI